ncbi:MAG: aspartate kinase [Clostridia bacterium]|nr:aspartate kinase [Clostridia bacterium]
MKVAKFGGTSLADAAQIKKVCNIMLSDRQRRFMVVSAPGKRFSEDIKVTDMLIACAEAVKRGESGEPEMEAVAERYISIAQELNVPQAGDKIREDLLALLKGTYADEARLMDTMKAAGEDNCAKLVAAYLNSLGEQATYIHPGQAGLLLTSEFGNAKVIESSYENLAELRKMKGIGVFPGFFGVSEKGEVVTFPRGGSDISGAILAAALRAKVYENFTDVDYVCAVNPKLVENACPIETITYREMRELSYAGFNVYQEEALLPVFRRGIPVNVRNVNNPSCPGTMIVAGREYEELPVVGIASDDDFCSIYVSKYLMNREVGFGRRLLEILENEGVSYEHTPTGIDDLSVVIRENQLTKEKLSRIVNRIKFDLQADDVHVKHHLSLVVIVGEGMRNSVGIAAKATAALAESGVNIEMISQGSSEVSMVFAVSNEDSKRAVITLYNKFFQQ